MVSYQAWVSIMFETIESSRVNSIEDGAGVMKLAGKTWSRNSETLSRYSQEQAAKAAERIVQKS